MSGHEESTFQSFEHLVRLGIYHLILARAREQINPGDTLRVKDVLGAFKALWEIESKIDIFCPLQMILMETLGTTAHEDDRVTLNKDTIIIQHRSTGKTIKSISIHNPLRQDAP
jgi:hypothetical protein